LRKKTAIDTKDLKILKVLDDLGGNASAAEIGELLPSFRQTRERKVGLGEKVVIVQENPEMGEALEKAIERLPIFYWYIPTYGRYNGYLIHAVYDMRAPKTIEKLTQRMKKLGLITGCETFDIVDYESKRVDFSKYRPNGTWRFDWNKWMENIAGNISNESEIPHHMDEDCDIIEYDAADLEILKILKGDPETPMLIFP
jgi:hypothetical protein